MAEDQKPVQPCRGHRSRISPKQPHVLCRGCLRWQYEAPGDVPEMAQEPDGTVSCAERVERGGQ